MSRRTAGMAGGMTGGMRVAGWALCACAGLAGAGCDGRTAGSPSAPEVAAGPPPEPPYPVVSRCASSTIRAGSPRRIDERDRSCSEEYEVDFVVEGGPGDAMLLDMFQSHILWNWRVRERGSTVEHAFSLRLRPHWRDYRSFVPLIRPYEPIVLQRCPEDEGEGPVLACTTERCGLYDDVDEVPALMPAELRMAISYPPEFLSDFPIIAEEAVDLPLTFRGFRPLLKELIVEARLDPTFGTGGKRHLTVEIAPSEIRLPAGWSGTDTIPVSVRVATSYAELRDLCLVCVEQGVNFEVQVNVYQGSCVTPPPVRARFHLLPEAESATSSTR